MSVEESPKTEKQETELETTNKSYVSPPKAGSRLGEVSMSWHTGTATSYARAETARLSCPIPSLRVVLGLGCV